MADVINGKAISAMKVAELQQELQRRGMSRNGRKSDLVERLRKSIEGEEAEDRVDQASSGEEAVCTSKEEALTVSADEAVISTDEAFLSTDEALAATEEIHPDSTCTAENASECMQPQVSSSTGEKGGVSMVEGAERMDGDGVLEVHLVGKDLQEFADEGAGEERGHQKESPVAKRRKLNLTAPQSTGGGGARRKLPVTATSTAPGLGVGRGSVAGSKDQRETEADMDVTAPLGGKEGDDMSCTTMPSGTPAGGSGGLRRSISAEVDEEYEKLRKEKERERESLRHKIELQKKEQARAEAREAEERRVLRAKELEKQAKETDQRQSAQSAAASAEEKSQRMEAKKHREELRRSMEEIRERRRSEARNRPPLEEKLELAPPRGDPSHVLHIQHLTRPFTNQQLMELLAEEGSLIERAFWTDKRKSYCYAAFRTPDEACVVAKRLHGLKWPSHNKRPLEVEFVSREEAHRGSNGSFEAPGVVPVRVDTPPLEELEGDWVEQGAGGGGKQEQVSTQAALLPQAAEQQPVQTEQQAQIHPPQPPEQTAPPPVQAAPPPQEDEGNTLDKLFRKTVTKPHIYWLPLTEEQAQARIEERRREDHEAQEKGRDRNREDPRSRDQGVRSRQQDRR